MLGDPLDSMAVSAAIVGTAVARMLNHALADLDITLEHLGILTLVDQGRVTSQADAAQAMHKSPSMVVKLVDHLEAAGAIERTTDPGNRRRHRLEVTAAGHRLLYGAMSRIQQADRDVEAMIGNASARAIGDETRVAVRHVLDIPAAKRNLRRPSDAAEGI